MDERPLLTGPSTASLEKLLEGAGTFTSPERSLAGLTAAQASIVPDGSPHSIAQLVAHVHYWQEWMLSAAETGEMPPFPEHAEVGWPEIDEDGWEALRGAFLAGIARAKQLGSDPTLLERKYISEDVPVPGWNRYTVGFVLADLAIHNAHHLGQIVLLRRIIGAWPPDGGGVTW